MSRRSGLRLLLLGGTGVAGRSTLPRLLAAGHRVVAHSRGRAGLRALFEAGAEPVNFDADDPHHLAPALADVDAVIDLRVAVPRMAHAVLPTAWRDYVRLRDQATATVVDAALATGTRRVIRDTVTFVYADGGDAWLDPTCPVDAPGPLASNLAAEGHLARLTAAGGIGVALRFGLFYGPDDVTSRDTIALARRGLSPVLGPDEAWHSAVHVNDVGTAVLAALAAPAGVYDVVDDEPLRRAELRSLLAGTVGRARLRCPPGATTALAPAAIKAQERSQRVSGAALRELTGWRPGVASRRTGWPAAVSAMAR